MSDRAQEGVLLLLFAVGIFLLWLRGYLTPYITAATNAIANAPAKVPFTIPGATKLNPNVVTTGFNKGGP